MRSTTHPCLSRRSSFHAFPKLSGSLILIPNHTHSCNSHYNAFYNPSPSSHEPANLSYTLMVKTRAASSRSQQNAVPDSEAPFSDSLLNNPDLLAQVSASKDATGVLQLFAERSGRIKGLVGTSDCCSIISAAFDRNNVDLALSVFYAMRSTYDQAVSENGPVVDKWKWSKPDVTFYSTLIQGLAASLRVSDALRVIQYVCKVGVSPGEEVPFGKIVRCPSCRIAVSVAQPQNGIQIATCGKCRYQYELISGDIVSITSEEISMDAAAWERGLTFLGVKKQIIPAAVHSIVVQTPSGVSRTHKFATETVDIPAQQGERVTIVLAAPSSLYREMGPLKFSPRAPDFYPGEPMSLINHKDSRESLLLRAPGNGNTSLFKPSILLPLLALFATGDVASGLIDPSLPQLLPIAAVASLGIGATLNIFVFPQLNQLPRKSVEAIAIKQQLLSQYDVLQFRIKDLKEAAEKEVWMLARMCQLEKKMLAVGERSYHARRSRIRRVREGLENSLRGRVELIENYARISSMIEIEVEVSSDVPVAETASNADSIADLIQQIMDLDALEERWKILVEANDEAERLLSSREV